MTNDPAGEAELRKDIIGKLSRLQLYAKDHPHDVTASDEADIEHTADELLALVHAQNKAVVERAELDAQIKVLEELLTKIDEMEDKNDRGYYETAIATEMRNGFNTGLIAASAPLEARIYTLKQQRAALQAVLSAPQQAGEKEEL